MKKNKFDPYQYKRAYEEIAKQIKQSILDKTWEHGERLPSDTYLAKQFQVGVQTIREALRKLEIQGLLKIKKGSAGGTFVEVGDPGNIASMISDYFTHNGITPEKISEARLVLESGNVKYAIKHATAEELARIEQFIDEWEIISDPDKANEGLTKRIQFSNLVAECTHNSISIFFTHVLMQKARRGGAGSWYFLKKEQLNFHRYMKLLFEAIKKKDVDLAQELVKEHVERVHVLVDRLNYK